MKGKFLLLCLFISTLLQAQQYNQLVATYLNNNLDKHSFTLTDVREFKVTSTSYSKSLNAQNVYISQFHNGIEIKNSSSSVVIKNNEVVYAAMAFQQNIANRFYGTQPSINATQAISNAANSLGLPINGITTLVNQVSDNHFTYLNESLSQENIPAKLTYILSENLLKLSWELGLYTHDGAHYYVVNIDAQDGSLIETTDLVISCSFDDVHGSHGTASQVSTYSFEKVAAPKASTSIIMDNASYRVFALPAESPDHAPNGSSLVTNPSNLIASPYGWHDTNGAVGPEFTITRGNNVFAQEDRDGDNSTFGNAPDGGALLNFDFPQRLQIPAPQNIDGSTVNLFYMNNIMHDIWYQYGFDEESGNFQQNNYGKGGLAGDFVIADAQDGSGFNNATFFPPSDGNNGRMNMFLWNGDASTAVNPLTVLNGAFAGSYGGVEASFGSSLPSPTSPLTGALVLLVDNNSGGLSSDPNDACDVIINSAALAGNIAILRRGNCQFGEKVLAAENAGAIAVIVVNNTGTNPISMGPGNVGNQVTIPSIMISQADGNTLIASLQANNNINIQLNNNGIVDNDGSLDNGVVAHEYGHGISTRLTGGPLNSGCLSNAEQMGEGWSDWFDLVITIEPGDTGADRRGIGTFVTNQTTTGRGIRNFPYSTNLSINPVTYASTNSPQFSVPHGIGSIWASMLWDLTWRFIDDYGFDPDVYNGTGGNNIAMQLIIDGMKLQPCSPGFVDGRDAIIQADLVANNGVNRDRIWEVFAARGLGLSALQGSSNSRFDQAEAFDVPTPLSLLENTLTPIKVYPNPSNGIVTIAAASPLTNATITVVDLNGRILLTQKEANLSLKTIDMQFLTNGVYILDIKSEVGSQSTKLIIGQ